MITIELTPKKVECPLCEKRIRPLGMMSHLRDKHNIPEIPPHQPTPPTTEGNPV